MHRLTNRSIPTPALALATVLALALPSAYAVGRATDPVSACALGKDIGLSTRTWRDTGGGVYGCSSPYKDIGPGFPMANNLAFYATGQQTRVTRMKLVLNVNNKSQAAAGLRALTAAAEKLAPKVLGAALPVETATALRQGRAHNSRVGTTRVTVVRDNWPTGLGYEVQLVLE